MKIHMSENVKYCLDSDPGFQTDDRGEITIKAGDIYLCVIIKYDYPVIIPWGSGNSVPTRSKKCPRNSVLLL